jgi:hypothetical protein
MTNYRPLLFLLAVAACEHADNLTTNEATAPSPQPTAPASVEPTPVPVAQPAPAPQPAPKPAVSAQPHVQVKAAPHTTVKELDQRCMSRAGCRWDDAAMRPRVTKKAAASDAGTP